MSLLRRYGKGLKAAALVVGITMGIGVWTYCNMDRMGRNSIMAEQNQRSGRKKAIAQKQTIGVLMDSSLEDKVRDDSIQALNDVAESYKKYVNIDYSFEFKTVDMSGEEIHESDLYSLVPSSFKDKDHRIFITNSSVMTEENDPDYMLMLGFYRYDQSTAIVHRAYLHQRSALYNIISHEMAHGQFMYHHVDDPLCIMYPVMKSSKKKNFCDEMVQAIIENK